MARSPYRYFAVLGVMRTGSNLLQRTLEQFPSINSHGELFNPAFIGSPRNSPDFGLTLAERDADPQALIEAMIRKGRNNTLSGFRLFDGHDLHAKNLVLADRTAAKIVLRRNPLDSYVSLKIARETDQWMLNKQRARRTAMIRFDLAEYQDYLTRILAFYAGISRVLKTTGQTAFEIDYADVRDLAVVNGIATWLGLDEQLESIEDTIQRQNPAELEDKVENYAEMVEALRTSGGVHRTGDGVSGDRAGGLRFMHVARSVPLLYAAIPGGPNEQVQRWMYGIDGGDPARPDFAELMASLSPLGTPQNRKALTDWLQTHPDHVCFTAVRHPVARAYDAFMKRIYTADPVAGFPRIRTHAETHFGMHLPAGDGQDADALAAAGYDADRHRAAFGAFLDFLRANIAGRTPMRVDTSWAPQHEFVDGFSSAVTLSMVLREQDLVAGAAYLRKRFGLGDLRNGVLKAREEHTPFTLAQIWSPQIEAQCRTIYARDYMLFGFGDWR